VMGAIGAALLAKREVQREGKTTFKGFDIAYSDYSVKSFGCEHCSNQCEVVEFYRDSSLVARWGDKCGRWSAAQLIQKEHLA
jgi:hypothetical protein